MTAATTRPSMVPWSRRTTSPWRRLAARRRRRCCPRRRASTRSPIPLSCRCSRRAARHAELVDQPDELHQSLREDRGREQPGVRHHIAHRSSRTPGSSYGLLGVGDDKLRRSTFRIGAREAFECGRVSVLIARPLAVNRPQPMKCFHDSRHPLGNVGGSAGIQ